MVPLRLELAADACRFAHPPRRVGDSALTFLNHLRFTSMACRAKPRADLFEACALLHVTRTANLQAHTDALMRCLAQALGKQPMLHAPGTIETSFDESWLVQLGQATARQDDASLAFLLKSRVLPEHRRLILFLITRVSDYFSLT